MHWYLEGTEEAVRALVQILAVERKSLAVLESEYTIAVAKHEVFYRDFYTADLQDDFDDLQVMNKFSRAGLAGIEATAASLALRNFKERIVARASSHAAICGALLQIAKQGISAEFGALRNNAPTGRMIGSEPIRNVIWEGRNQCLHFEDPGSPHAAVRATFGNLETDFGPQFHLAAAPASRRNLAGEVIQVLDWWNYENYLKDLRSILEQPQQG